MTTRKKISQRTTRLPIRHTLRNEFYRSVSEILKAARSNVYRAVNFAMVEAYWNVGRLIVEEEQKGQKRAGYGQSLLKSLADYLTAEFGRGFSEANLKNFRQFYFCFPIRYTLCSESPVQDSIDQPQGASDILHTPCQGSDKAGRDEVRPSAILPAVRRELTWSHYRLLMRVEKPLAREWYMKEAAEQNWSVRALERQVNSLYYERLKMSRNKKPVVKEMREKTGPLAAKPEDFIKDPYVLEFLGMKDSPGFRESDLERSIIGKLQAFMLELGKGFAFVGRQQRISTETKDFFIDLVFYNYLLKCFVLIDLKTGELTHQDIGQMDMYVRLYEDKCKGKDDNPTIGIILCTDKDETVVKYSVLKENKRLFASKYKLYLPTERELIEEIEREKEMFVREREAVYGGGR